MACWALLGTKFQLENRMIKCEAKNPELNTALDKRESKQVGGGKRLKKEETALPKPLDRAETCGAHDRGKGGGTSREGCVGEQANHC